MLCISYFTWPVLVTLLRGWNGMSTWVPLECHLSLCWVLVWTSQPFNPVDISGTVVGESPDCQLLSGTLVGENPDHVYWASDILHSHQFITIRIVIPVWMTNLDWISKLNNKLRWEVQLFICQEGVFYSKQDMQMSTTVIIYCFIELIELAITQ